MSNMVIEIINVANTVVPTAKGSYSKLEVTYKNKSFQDKVESKPIMDFAAKEVFKVLKEAKFGDIFFISRVKNDKGFWDWTKATTEEQPEMNTSVTTPKTSSVTPTPKSTYETAEERAARQLMIVRQSSISNAIAMLALEKKPGEITPGLIINIAKEFESYVMSKEDKNPWKEIPEELPYDLGN